MPVKITGTLVIEEEYDTDPRAAIDRFFDEHGIDPDTIDGKGFIGTCDGCDAIILEGETYSESDEDEVRCSACIDKHQAELAGGEADSEDPEDIGTPDIFGEDLVADSEDPEDLENTEDYEYIEDEE